jgi:hypothetical protein
MNRLAAEKSPYLLQHADNPVDWYPWGDEAFAAARREGKPIFLSVGYSTCHWCHVMAHESFEDDRVAARLNAYFVAVKVDREERPDVDRIYMSFVQATTGGGGWPMNVWLTPDLRPFYGGTYFPPTSRWGRPGFVDLLDEIARLWREERGRLEEAAADIGERLSVARAVRGADGVPGVDVLDGAVQDLLSIFDRRHGGFGGAPKFPRPSELLFLLREHRRTGAHAPLDAVLQTLAAMAAGGIYDHLGGGFHRYSVDAQWRVPHFEKMLYDQAQLVLAYLEATQASGDRFFLEVAEDTLRYVRRDLTDAAGGFHSAEDADSLPPGERAGGHQAEGAFYLWTAKQVEECLGQDGAAFAERFGVRPGGNALQDPQGEFAGANILFVARPIDEIAAERHVAPETLRASLARSRQVLLAARAARPRPHRDDKVLTAWNGLMIAAFARASRVGAAFAAGPGAPLAEAAGDGFPAACLATARRAAAFLRDRMWDPSARRLYRRYRDGEAAIDAYAEDYACLVFGLIELFQADGDAAWLEWALTLQACQDERFWDGEHGGWFSTTGDDPSLLLRLKEDYDGAEPAASSVAALNLLAFRHLVPDRGAEKSGRPPAGRLERTFALFAPRLKTAPRAVPMMLAALSAWHAGGSEVVIVGKGAGALALRYVVDRVYLPFSITLSVEPGNPSRDALLRVVPSVGPMGLLGGLATAYVCRDFACQPPVTEPARLEAHLR